MSFEAVITCDECSTVILGAHTVDEARRENRENGGYSEFLVDLCPRCVASGVTADSAQFARLRRRG